MVNVIISGANGKMGHMLSHAIGDTEDVSIVDPRAAEVASLVLTRFASPNIQAYASLDFLGVPFAREMSEEFPINETILKTSIRGIGSISGSSVAELVPDHQVRSGQIHQAHQQRQLTH